MNNQFIIVTLKKIVNRSCYYTLGVIIINIVELTGKQLMVFHNILFCLSHIIWKILTQIAVYLAVNRSIGIPKCVICVIIKQHHISMNEIN